MAIDKNKLIKVKNRYDGIVGYDVQDMSIPHRDYYPNETKEVTFEELEKVAATPQGRVILEDYLIIEDPEAVNELLHHVEPEYYYTEDKIKELLTTPNNYDAFLDCLDFAPSGVIDMIKDLAVNLPIHDDVKKNAILEKTGFNVNNAIAAANAKTGAELDAEKEGKELHKEDSSTPKRRVAAPTEPQPQRRVVIKKN